MVLAVFLAQSTSVVYFEVVSTDSPVTLLTVGLALCLAVFIGTDLANVAPDHHKVANTIKTNFFLSRCGQSSSRGIPLANLSSRPENHKRNLPPEIQGRQISSSFPMQLPCILYSSVQKPGHDAIIPFLPSNLDSEMVDVLIQPVHPSLLLLYLLTMSG